jgi:hypothetical protein
MQREGQVRTPKKSEKTRGTHFLLTIGEIEVRIPREIKSLRDTNKLLSAKKGTS